MELTLFCPCLFSTSTSTSISISISISTRPEADRDQIRNNNVAPGISGGEWANVTLARRRLTLLSRAALAAPQKPSHLIKFHFSRLRGAQMKAVATFERLPMTTKMMMMMVAVCGAALICIPANRRFRPPRKRRKEGKEKQQQKTKTACLALFSDRPTDRPIKADGN